MTHCYHEGQGGYSPAQVLHDGCAECERHGRRAALAIEHMSPESLDKAWLRAATWGRTGLTDASNAEREVLATLWIIQVKLEQRGVPIGALPWLPRPAQTWPL